MPEGIIRDPKQNQDEKRFGVLFSPEGGYIAYDKKGNNPRRFITSGTLVDFPGVKQMNPSEVFLWDGKVIDYEVSNLIIKSNDLQGPVVKALNAEAQKTLPSNPPAWP